MAFAVLVPEVGNPYDASAVSVWIEGMQVGYLSRENAARYRPGLLGLQESTVSPSRFPASSPEAAFAMTDLAA